MYEVWSGSFCGWMNSSFRWLNRDFEAKATETEFLFLVLYIILCVVVNRRKCWTWNLSSASSFKTQNLCMDTFITLSESVDCTLNEKKLQVNRKDMSVSLMFLQKWSNPKENLVLTKTSKYTTKSSKRALCFITKAPSLPEGLGLLCSL